MDNLRWMFLKLSASRSMTSGQELNTKAYIFNRSSEGRSSSLKGFVVSDSDFTSPGGYALVSETFARPRALSVNTLCFIDAVSGSDFRSSGEYADEWMALVAEAFAFPPRDLSVNTLFFIDAVIFSMISGFKFVKEEFY